MIAPVFAAAKVSQLVEQVAGAAMARVAFDEGHRKAFPVIKAKVTDKAVEDRRVRVLEMRLGGCEVNEIAQKVRTNAQTIKHDLQVLRQRGDLPATAPRKVA